MGLTVYGGGGKPEEEKTVTAGTSVIEVLPSSGKVMKKVTVNPTPTESKSVTPTTSELTVTPSEGKHLSQVVVGAMEDVTPEVTAQTPVITQILEGLVGKAQGANATADKILEGYSAYVGQTLVNGTATKSGQYVWKKLTAEGGDFVDFVTDDSETKYPDGGTQDGYWYEKVVEGLDLLSAGGYTKVAVDKYIFSSGTSVYGLTLAHSLGTTPTLLLVLGGSMPTVSACVKDIFCELGSAIVFTLSGSSLESSKHSIYLKDTNIDFNKNTFSFEAGIEYTLITMA